MKRFNIVPNLKLEMSFENQRRTLDKQAAPVCRGARLLFFSSLLFLLGLELVCELTRRIYVTNKYEVILLWHTIQNSVRKLKKLQPQLLLFMKRNNPRVGRICPIKYITLHFHIETANFNQRLFYKLAIKAGNCPRILQGEKEKITARPSLFSMVHIYNKLNKYSSVHRFFLKKKKTTTSWMFMCSSLVFKSILFNSSQGSTDHHSEAKGYRILKWSQIRQQIDVIYQNFDNYLVRTK